MQAFRVGCAATVSASALLFVLGPSNAPASTVANAALVRPAVRPAGGTTDATASASVSHAATGPAARSLDMTSTLARRLNRHGLLQEPVTEKDFDPDNFGRSSDVDNPWNPLDPGTQLIYAGSAMDDGKLIDRQVTISVTELTKVVGGVRTRVIWERDFNDGALVESELAFFGQDLDGNVWQLGQYPEERDENGDFVDAQTWISGVEGAKAGIAMRAFPREDTTDYSQGFAPTVDFTDRAVVHETGASTCEPVGFFDDVLVIHETAADEPASAQVKYYARGIGNIRVGWTGEDQEQEELDLFDISHLDRAGLSEVNAQSEKLERSAYGHSPDVYGRTPPMRLDPGRGEDDEAGRPLR